MSRVQHELRPRLAVGVAAVAAAAAIAAAATRLLRLLLLNSLLHLLPALLRPRPQPQPQRPRRRREHAVRVAHLRLPAGAQHDGAALAQRL